MSEFTDDVIDGARCEECGEYFVEEYGYPKKCVACGGDGVTV